MVPVAPYENISTLIKILHCTILIYQVFNFTLASSPHQHVRKVILDFFIATADPTDHPDKTCPASNHRFIFHIFAFKRFSIKGRLLWNPRCNQACIKFQTLHYKKKRERLFSLCRLHTVFNLLNPHSLGGSIIKNLCCAEERGSTQKIIFYILPRSPSFPQKYQMCQADSWRNKTNLDFFLFFGYLPFEDDCWSH